MVRWVELEGDSRRSLACGGGAVRRAVFEEARFSQMTPADSKREPATLEVAISERFGTRDEPWAHATKTGRCG
jgi:hypothetical protein